MGFELGTGFLIMTDRDTGEQFDLGEVAPMEMEVEEWSNKEEPSKTIKGFTNPATFSCENATIIPLKEAIRKVVSKIYLHLTLWKW